VRRIQSTCPNKDAYFIERLRTTIYEWVETESLGIAASNGYIILMTDAYGTRAPEISPRYLNGAVDEYFF
jgi:hypothetical protein